MDGLKKALFERSGSRLKNTIPILFCLNILGVLLAYIISMVAALIESGLAAVFLTAVVGFVGVILEIGAVYLVMMFFYSLAEQSDNSCQMLELMQMADLKRIEKEQTPAAPAPVAAEPVAPAPVTVELAPTLDEPVLKARSTPLKKPEQPATQQEGVVKCPSCGTIQKESHAACWACNYRFKTEVKQNSFADALRFALRYQTWDGFCRQLESLRKKEAYSQHWEELDRILALPEEERRKAVEDLAARQ